MTGERNYADMYFITSTMPVMMTRPTMAAPAMRLIYNSLRSVNLRRNKPTITVSSIHHIRAPNSTPATTRTLSARVPWTPINVNAPINTKRAKGLVMVRKNVDTKSCHKLRLRLEER